MRKLFRRAGINGIKQSPHVFRHTFASLATAAGCPTYLVERLLRHSINRRNVTYRYIHADMGQIREALERFSPLRLLAEEEPTFGKTRSISDSEGAIKPTLLQRSTAR